MALFSSKIGQFNILMAAEMDCIDQDKKLVPQDENNMQFLELKTIRALDSERAYSSFCKFKAPKCWIQGKLANLKYFVFGFRNDAGIIMNTKVYTIDELLDISNMVR